LTPEDLIEEGYKKFDYSLKKDLLDKLLETNPYYFEKIILMLFKEMGY
jgi:restriction system protein